VNLTALGSEKDPIQWAVGSISEARQNFQGKIHAKIEGDTALAQGKDPCHSL